MRISDWSSDVCSSDLEPPLFLADTAEIGSHVCDESQAIGIGESAFEPDMHFFGCTDELQDRVAGLEIIIPVEEIVGIVSRQESLKAVRRTKSRVEISVGIKGRNRLLKHKDRDRKSTRLNYSK